ncbi:MAG: PHP domain-containing protein [Myxococcota bacterium]
MLGSLGPAARFDLHMHSNRSDGRFEPEEVLRRAARGGLDVIALTDHDLPTALAPGPRQVEGRTLHLVAGAEVSATHEGHEYHLLVYFAGEVPAGFRAFCAEQCKERVDRYEATRTTLSIEGLPAPSAAARQGEQALTRHHLARSMVEQGHATSVADAFARHLSHRHGKVRKMSMPYVEAIRLARDHGGITSWAHPPMEGLRAVPAFAKAGLHALEAWRPPVSGSDRRRLRRLARDHGLFLTGGSDWHGWGDPDHLGLFAVERRELNDFCEALS